MAEELRLSGIQGGGSGPVLDAELSENRAKMELDAVNGDGQLARDLPIRETTGGKGKYVAFAWRETQHSRPMIAASRPSRHDLMISFDGRNRH